MQESIITFSAAIYLQLGKFTFSCHRDRWHLSLRRRKLRIIRFAVERQKLICFLLRFLTKQQTAFAAYLTVSLFSFEKSCFFEVTDPATDGECRKLEVSDYGWYGMPTFVVLVRPIGEIDIYRNGSVREFGK